MLTKNFGLKVNGESFLSLANSTDFSVVRKLQNDAIDLEAVFFGQTDLLNDDVQDAYYLELQKRYQFLKQKFRLNKLGVLPLQFFRLRPPNFPTIRLSQLANLYHTRTNLFSELINVSSKKDVYKILDIETSEFWKSHYTFSKTSKVSKKALTKSFIDLLVINTIIPLQFTYAKVQGRPIEDHIFNFMRQIGVEKNSIVFKFLSLKPLEKHALMSQAFLQLKQNYCDKNKCLQCAIGNSLIVKN